MPSHMHLNVRRNVPVHGSIWESIFPRTFKGYDLVCYTAPKLIK